MVSDEGRRLIVGHGWWLVVGGWWLVGNFFRQQQSLEILCIFVYAAVHIVFTFT